MTTLAQTGQAPVDRRAAAVGKTVRVTRVNRSTVKGTLVSLSDSEVAVRLDTGVVAIPLNQVQQVERTTRYALLGAGVGVLSGAALTVAGCASGGCQDDGGSYLTGYMLLMTGAGAGIGAIVNATTRDERVLYRRPGTSRSVSVAPILGARRAGIVMRW